MGEKSEFDPDLENPIHPVTSNAFGQCEAVDIEHDTTQRGLKSRHAQMIALGGTIGTGLFVGSGQGLNMGGPISLVLSYLILTVLVYGIVTCTTEMSSYLPVPGSSVSYYANRFLSPSLGFALGWIYWYVFSITVPAEITAGALVIEYWNPPVHQAVWITLLMVVIVGLNCMPVKMYGETEFWFASLKVIGIMGLLVMAVVLILGGGPNHDRLGFRYWITPGPFNEYIVTGDSGRLVAFISVLTFSYFAFAFSPELLVVTGGEMQSPRYNLPIAGRRYFYRLIIFYILGAFAISLIVSSKDEALLGGGKGAGTSPWAIAAKNAGITGLDSVINAIILTSAWSAGNSYLFLASRALYSMSLTGKAPRIFSKCTASGIPYNALAGTAVFSLLSYLNCSSSAATVFNWFVNLINTGGYISWISICVIYVRFRKATEVQQIVDLPFRSALQPVMAYVCGFIFTLLLLLSGLKNFVGGNWNTSSFITSYVGIAIFAALYFGHKVLFGRNDPWAIPAERVDLISGLDAVLAAERPPVKEEGKRSPLRKLKVIFG